MYIFVGKVICTVVFINLYTVRSKIWNSICTSLMKEKSSAQHCPPTFAIFKWQLLSCHLVANNTHCKKKKYPAFHSKSQDFHFNVFLMGGSISISPSLQVSTFSIFSDLRFVWCQINFNIYASVVLLWHRFCFTWKKKKDVLWVEWMFINAQEFNIALF